MSTPARSRCVAVVCRIVCGLTRFPPLRALAFLYTQLFRGIALYVLLGWIWFGLALAIGLKLQAEIAGIVALSLLNSAYLSEIFRASPRPRVPCVEQQRHDRRGVADDAWPHRRSWSRASSIAAASTRTPVAVTRARARAITSSTGGLDAVSIRTPRRYS